MANWGTRRTELLTRIYDASMAPRMWPGILSEIAGWLGAEGAIVFERHAQLSGWSYSAAYLSGNYRAGLLEAYLKRFGDWEARDQLLFERSALESDSIELIEDADLTGGAGHKALPDQPNSRFLKALGLHRRAAALLDKDNPARDRFSVQFAEGHKTMSAVQHRCAREILPHLAKSMSMSRHLQTIQTASSVALAALNQLRLGVAVTDREGRTVFENTAFQETLDDSRLIAKDARGGLSVPGDRPSRAFRRLLGSVDNHGRCGARPRKEAVTLDTDVARNGLCLEIAPLGRLGDLSDQSFDGHVITCLDMKRAQDIDLAPLAGHFGLSPAEISIMPALIEGASNRSIAEALGRSVETVNSHVKSLFSKTGCQNRTQLVRLAAGLGQRMLTKPHS